MFSHFECLTSLICQRWIQIAARGRLEDQNSVSQLLLQTLSKYWSHWPNFKEDPSREWIRLKSQINRQKRQFFFWISFNQSCAIRNEIESDRE